MNPHRPNFGQAILIPVPWDPIYQRNFSRVIEQLGERYASDPLCVSVVLTCANFMSAEMHLPKTREDLAKWKAFGNYEEKLLEVYKKYTDEWAKAFPRQEISLHVSKVLDLPPEFCERIIDYGLSKYRPRFTIQNCQLTGRREDTGMMTYDLIQKYRDRAHHGFQSLAGLSYPNERMGSIEMAALNMVHARGRILGTVAWRWYERGNFNCRRQSLGRGQTNWLRRLQEEIDVRRQIPRTMMTVLQPGSDEEQSLLNLGLIENLTNDPSRCC